jgi:hypothetical protein
MRRRAELPTLLFALAVGCGKAQAVSDDGGVIDSMPSDSGSDGLGDARVSGTSPACCVPLTHLMLPDAAPGMCLVTPADVACEASDDCEPNYVRGCAICGVFSVYGLSKLNTLDCPPPPCEAPPQPVPPALTQASRRRTVSSSLAMRTLPLPASMASA